MNTGTQFLFPHTLLCTLFNFGSQWTEKEENGRKGIKKPRKPNRFAGLKHLKKLLWNFKVMGLSKKWCRRRDSNSHDRGSLPPQDSVSTNSTTAAHFFYFLLQGTLKHHDSRFISRYFLFLLCCPFRRSRSCILAFRGSHWHRYNFFFLFPLLFHLLHRRSLGFAYLTHNRTRAFAG